MNDWELLQKYALHGSEAAFCTLVERYLNLVHSVAMRQVHDAHLAEEVSQAVFILLARKAGSLKDGLVLSGSKARNEGIGKVARPVGKAWHRAVRSSHRHCSDYERSPGRSGGPGRQRCGRLLGKGDGRKHVAGAGARDSECLAPGQSQSGGDLANSRFRGNSS